MRNRLKLLIPIFLLVFLVFSFAENNIDFIKTNNGFYFFKSSGKSIFIKKDNSSYTQSFIDISTDSFSNKRFFLRNGDLFLYTKTENQIYIYKLEGKIWEKKSIVSKDDIPILNPEPFIFIGLKTYSKIVRRTMFLKSKDNIIIKGNIRYIIPENFKSFYLEKDNIYTLNIFGKTLLIKKFKVKSALPYPPLDVSLSFNHNYSLYSEEYINEVKWAANPMNSSVLNYYIYRRDTSVSNSDFVFQTKIPPKTYFYLERGLKKEDEGRFVYGVSVVDITLGESDIITTTGNIIKSTLGPLKIYQFNNE